MATGAAWCGQCFAAASSPAVAPSSVWSPGRGEPALAPLMRRTRWRKTTTTFGPVGRLVASLAVLLPLALMAVGGLVDPFVWGGAGFWLLVVVPWTMRDIWKAGQIPAR